MSAFGNGSNSNGQFWYGNTTNFPGFLYKKNLGVGGRRSTKFNPGGNITCNNSTYLYNKYKPGSGGVGASSTSNRRAKNRIATVCENNNCFPCYNSLGQYSNYTHNPNGYFDCIPIPPLPIPIYNDGEYQTIVSTNGYIYSSTNYGNTWNIVYYNSDIQFYFNLFSKNNNSLYQSASTTTPGLNFFESKDINSWSPTSQPNLTTVNTNLSITGSYDLKYQTVSSYDTSSNLTTFYSTDYGKTWSQSITQLYYNIWLSADYTGSSQLSCGFNINNEGYVYYSYDYGKTWNAILNIPKLPYSGNKNNPTGTCISGDNSVWLIGDFNGYIQYSTNNGKNWNLSNITNTNNSFGLIKSSYSGNVIITISYLFQNVYSGRFYISYDKGANFGVPSDLSSLPLSNWLSCDISASGKIITALSETSNDSYFYYISTDYGVTWKITDVTDLLDNGIINIAIN
jgi:photosystem II stability/assembly factor-like uncharacterized protein